MSGFATLDAGRMAMHRKRKLINVVALTLALGAMAFGIF
ncbi:MAG: phosphate ABC transporter permease PtsA, partial [Rhizobacter sp.]